MTDIVGLLNIDKPPGLTSHDVVNRVRRVCGLRRVGHAGTLDPLATGVLLVCLGRATRLLEYLSGQPKMYVATVRLGQTTNTYDAEGEVLEERSFEHIPPTLFEDMLADFRGDISQRPPIYSAIKKGGQPLYKLARQGVTVEVPLREVTIYELTLVDWDLPYVTIRVACSTGTYIRSLAHDMGEQLGCGGHITALRRMAIGSFHVDKAVTLEALSKEGLSTWLEPLDRAVSHLPRVEVSAEAVMRLFQGQAVPHGQELLDVGDPWQRAYGPSGNFVGIVKALQGYWKPHKMFPPVDSV